MRPAFDKPSVLPWCPTMGHTGRMAVVLGVLADTEAEAHEWVDRLTALGYTPVGRVMAPITAGAKWLARLAPPADALVEHAPTGTSPGAG